MPRKTIAALEAYITEVEQRLTEEKSAAIRARTELTEERKRNERLTMDVRAAEEERSRLQGYIDRVREEQGAKIGNIDTRPMCRSHDYDNDRGYR